MQGGRAVSRVPRPGGMYMSTTRTRPYAATPHSLTHSQHRCCGPCWSMRSASTAQSRCRAPAHPPRRRHPGETPKNGQRPQRACCTFRMLKTRGVSLGIVHLIALAIAKARWRLPAHVPLGIATPARSPALAALRPLLTSIRLRHSHTEHLNSGDFFSRNGNVGR